MKNNHLHIADLIAFVKLSDLPPSLYPFVKSMDWKKKNLTTEEDIRIIILKIRGTVDSYHAVVVKDDVDVGYVEEQIHKDLESTKLSDKTREKLKELFAKFRCGEFTYFMNHEVDIEKYPRRH